MPGMPRRSTGKVRHQLHAYIIEEQTHRAVIVAEMLDVLTTEAGSSLAVKCAREKPPKEACAPVHISQLVRSGAQGSGRYMSHQRKKN